jgi:hypothetical protein
MALDRKSPAETQTGAFDPTETSNLIASEPGWVPFPSRRPAQSARLLVLQKALRVPGGEAGGDAYGRNRKAPADAEGQDGAPAAGEEPMLPVPAERFLTQPVRTNLPT